MSEPKIRLRELRWDALIVAAVNALPFLAEARRAEALRELIAHLVDADYPTEREWHVMQAVARAALEGASDEVGV